MTCVIAVVKIQDIAVYPIDIMQCFLIYEIDEGGRSSVPAIIDAPSEGHADGTVESRTDSAAPHETTRDRACPDPL